MSAIKLSTPSSGSISLSPADTASNLTITVPAVSGTMAIQGPAFSAYAGATTSFAANTVTKINFNTEEFDTNSNYDTSTSRFTPTVAGYYIIDGGFEFSDSSAAYLNVIIYKNGNAYKGGTNSYISSNYRVYANCLVYCNGSTDYIELYGFSNKVGTSMAFQAYTYFQGVLVRAA
jgi:hypothetical protein